MTNKQKTKTGVKTPKPSKAKIPKSVLLPHKCPTCKNKANTESQAVEIFGLRNMGDKTRCQSYCRDCRTKHGKKMDRLREKNKKLEKLDLRTMQGHKKLKAVTK